MVPIIAAIAAIPQIIKSVQGLIRFLDENLGPDWPKRINEINTAYKELDDAKTPQEYLRAAANIAASLRRQT